MDPDLGPNLVALMQERLGQLMFMPVVFQE
jgi:hypothetical protein